MPVIQSESVERSEIELVSFRSAFSEVESGKREGACARPKLIPQGPRKIRGFCGGEEGQRSGFRPGERPKYYDDDMAGEGIVAPPDEKGVARMLSLTLAPGEYLTIGGDVVVQLDRMTGGRCKLMIQAPREVPVLRGEVLERKGGERPDCVFDAPRWRRTELPWDRSKAQALNAMRALLSKMDGGDENVKALRRQLNHMFPPEGTAEQAAKVSNG